MNTLLADNAGAAIGSALILLSLLALVALWGWTLVDAIREPGYRAGTKLRWVLVIALTGLLGAAVYLAMGRPTQQPASRQYLSGAH